MTSLIVGKLFSVLSSDNTSALSGILKEKILGPKLCLTFRAETIFKRNHLLRPGGTGGAGGAAAPPIIFGLLRKAYGRPPNNFAFRMLPPLQRFRPCAGPVK